jgi:hypothetical protein
MRFFVQAAVVAWTVARAVAPLLKAASKEMTLTGLNKKHFFETHPVLLWLSVIVALAAIWLGVYVLATGVIEMVKDLARFI